MKWREQFSRDPQICRGDDNLPMETAEFRKGIASIDSDTTVGNLTQSLNMIANLNSALF